MKNKLMHTIKVIKVIQEQRVIFFVFCSLINMTDSSRNIRLRLL